MPERLPTTLRDRLASHTGSPTVTVTALVTPLPVATRACRSHAYAEVIAGVVQRGGRAETAGDHGASELTATPRS
jgi:hypothetical protein